MERKYSLTRAATAKTSNRWAPDEVSLTELLNMFTNPENVAVRQDKDGHCVVGGRMVGTTRRGEAIEYLDLITFDVDGAQTFVNAKMKLEAAGVGYIMYTTHSHLKTTTYVPLNKLSQFASKKRIDIKNKPPHHVPGLVDKFLVDQKLDKVLKNYSYGDRTVHRENGMCVAIKHDPIEKFRIVIPLARPILFTDLGNTSRESIAGWKERYITVGRALGLEFDRACSDPARLFYLPSVPPDGEEKWRCATNLPFSDDDGERKFLDIYDYTPDGFTADDEREDGHEYVGAGGAASEDPGEPRIFRSADGGEFNVSDWCRRYLKGIAGEIFFKLLVMVRPDDFLREGESATKYEEGFRHIECPYEDGHTEPGGTGTFFKLDPDQSDYVMIRCQHTSCQGRLNEDFVLGMLERGWITRDNLAMVQRVYANLGRDATLDIEDELNTQLTTFVAQDDVPAMTEPSETAEQGEAKIEEAIKGIKDIDERVRDYLGKCHTIQDFKVFWGTVAIQENIERDTANETVMASLTRLPFSVLSTYYQQIMPRMSVSAFRYFEFIQWIREALEPYNVGFNKIFEGNLRNDRLKDALRELGGYYNIPIKKIYDEYNTFISNQKEAVEIPINNRAKELNEQYAKIVENGKTYFVDMDVFRADGEVRLYSKEGVRDLHSNETYKLQYTENKQTTENAFDWWLKEIPDHKVFYGRKFAPDQFGEETPFLNTYAGLRRVKPVPGDTDPLTNHIKTVWCDGSEELYAWVMTWFAQIVQYPGHRFPSSIMLIGDQGTGKSMVMEKCFTRVFDPYVFVATKRNDISGDFNSHMADKLLFVGEEALFRGDLKMMDQLKAYISSRQFSMTRKGVDTQQVDFFTRFFFASNHEDALQIDSSDRRFLVLKAAPTHRQDIEYFQSLADYFDNGGVGHVFHMLNKWVPEEHGMVWNDLFKPPTTQAKLYQVEQSFSVPDKFWMDLIVNGRITLEGAEEQGQFLWPLGKETKVKLSDLQTLFLFYVAKTENRSYNRNKFSSSFERMCGINPSTSVTMMSVSAYAEPEAYVILPPRRNIVERNKHQMTEKQYALAVRTDDTAEADQESVQMPGGASASG